MINWFNILIKNEEVHFHYSKYRKTKPILHYHSLKENLGMKSLLFGALIMLTFFTCTPQPANSVKETIEIPSKDFKTLLAEKNINLPILEIPKANYVHTVRTGNLVFTAGKGPKDGKGNTIVGKLGFNLSVEEGYQAARSVGVQQLAALQQELGDLNKVKRIVKVLGMVNSSDDFKDQSKVVNGFSDLMVEIFGEAGKHARSAVGMASLPGGMAVEIEMIVEVYPEH